jgi:hypothetical protein
VAAAVTFTMASWVWTLVLGWLLILVIGVDSIVHGVKRAVRRRGGWR